MLKQQGFLARMATQPNKVKETLALLGQELSTRQDIDLKVFLTYLNQYMLAEK
jgi:hypothetical protein